MEKTKRNIDSSDIELLHNMIEEYIKFTGKEPYIILVTPRTYLNVRNESKSDKITYIFGIPVEISNYILPEAVCMNKRDYRNYCINKHKLQEIEQWTPMDTF